MIDVNNKKILFIAPAFYDYEVELSDLLRRQYHAEVIFYPEKKYDFLHLCIYRLHFLKQQFFKKYYQNILIRCRKEHPDVLLVIRGASMPEFFLVELKKINPSIQTVMYQWDSEKNNHYIHLRSFWDILKTFDPADAKKFDIPYLPLFYTSFPEKIEREDYKSDCLFVAMYYPERYKFFLQLKEQLKKENLSFKYYIYLPFVLYVKLLLQGKAPKRKFIQFNQLDRKLYQMWLLNTNIVIDYTISSQSGLPMRIIEAIGAEKKIATNNKHLTSNEYPAVRHYPIDFRAFLNTPATSPQESLSYRLDSWLQQLFS